MPKVLHLPSRCAGNNVHTPAPITAKPSGTQQPFDQVPRDPVARQAAIENALTMALYFIRQPSTSAANLWAATARANRALTLLKQASQGTGNTANTIGRA